MKRSVEYYAKRNLWLYIVVKIFNKRVFLPVIVIYFVDRFGFSIQEIGILAAIYGIVSIVADVPTGYFADRYGRVNTIRVAAILQIIASLLYITVTQKSGIIFAQILESLAFSFLSGAAEALVHDSLEVTKQTKQYSKVLSRAQSIALVANAALIASVPLTYAIDPRLPFLIGTLAFVGLGIAGIYMREVLPHAPRQKLVWRRADALAALARNKLLLFAALLFGTVSAIYFSFDIFTLAMRHYGIKPEFIGFVFAAASLVGAVVGLFIHHLKKLNITHYAFIDVTILLLPFLSAVTANALLLAGSIVISIAFWRFRRIIYQDHLLTLFPTNYKATLISGMSMSESINYVWIPVVTTSIVGVLGFVTGFGVIACAVVGIAVPYVVLMHMLFVHQQSAVVYNDKQ